MVPLNAETIGASGNNVVSKQWSSITAVDADEDEEDNLATLCSDSHHGGAFSPSVTVFSPEEPSAGSKSKNDTKVSKIDIRQQGQAAPLTSPPVTRFEAAKVFDELDSDRKGFLSAEELMYFFSLIGQKSQCGKEEGLTVTADEIRMHKMVKSLSISGANLSSQGFENIMKFLDSNGDGTISRDEFVMAYKALDVQAKIEVRCKRHASDGLKRPCILAHRGTPGYNAPHSLAGYEEAVAAGADYIEFDVISCKDGKLIICHDVTLEGETDVDTRFPEREAKNDISSAVDGDPLEMEGYFAKDFTWEEVQSLHKVETWAFRVVGKERADKEVMRVQTVRSAAAFLEDLRQKVNDDNPNRNFGLVIELKRPQWHADIGLPLEDQLLADIDASGFKGPIIIQCFEEKALRYIRAKRPNYLYMKLLIDCQTCREVCIDTKHGVPEKEEELEPFFKQIAEYAEIVSPWKKDIVPNPALPPLSSALMDTCLKLNLEVMPYTFRSDINFLHQAYGGNATEEYFYLFLLFSIPSFKTVLNSIENRFQSSNHQCFYVLCFFFTFFKNKKICAFFQTRMLRSVYRFRRSHATCSRFVRDKHLLCELKVTNGRRSNNNLSNSINVYSIISHNSLSKVIDE